jgi:hypothetical protein
VGWNSRRLPVEGERPWRWLRAARQERRRPRVASLGTKPAWSERWAAAGWRQLRQVSWPGFRGCVFELPGGGFRRLRCGGCFGGWGRLAGWGGGGGSPRSPRRPLAQGPRSDPPREWENARLPMRARLPRRGVSSVLVQGIRGSLTAADRHRLVSLGCLIAFGFDLCRLIQV